MLINLLKRVWATVRHGLRFIPQYFATRKYRRYVGSVFVGKHGIRYVIDDESAVDMYIVNHGIYDEWISHGMSTIVADDAVVLDIGANVGHLALLFAMIHVPRGRVYSFEPEPGNFEKLGKNISVNGVKHLLPFQVALQEDPQVTQISFFTPAQLDAFGVKNTGVSSLLEATDEIESKIVVSATTLDKFVAEHGIRKVDFIKIDVEGAEYRVLRGGLNLLKRDLPAVLYEYSDMLEVKFGNTNSHQTYELLKSLGYRQFLIDQETSLVELVDNQRSITLSNILCLHPSRYDASKIESIVGLKL